MIANDQLSPLFLSERIKLVKKHLGEACTFLSFSKEKSRNTETGEIEEFFAFNAVMKNDYGGKDRIIYRIDRPLSTLTSDDFHGLAIDLNSRAYEKRANS